MRVRSNVYEKQETNENHISDAVCNAGSENKHIILFAASKVRRCRIWQE